MADLTAWCVAHENDYHALRKP